MSEPIILPAGAARVAAARGLREGIDFIAEVDTCSTIFSLSLPASSAKPAQEFGKRSPRNS